MLVRNFKILCGRRGLKCSSFFARIKDEENMNRIPALEQSVPLIRERDKVRVKLPKLQREKFSGDSKQYRAFRELEVFCALSNHFFHTALHSFFISSSQLLPSLHIFWNNIINGTTAGDRIPTESNIEAILFNSSLLVTTSSLDF